MADQENAPVEAAPAAAPQPTTGGVMIQASQTYALSGGVILGIVEALRNQLPIRYLDLVLSVENTLATGKPIGPVNG